MEGIVLILRITNASITMFGFVSRGEQIDWVQSLGFLFLIFSDVGYLEGVTFLSKTDCMYWNSAAKFNQPWSL